MSASAMQGGHKKIGQRLLTNENCKLDTIKPREKRATNKTTGKRSGERNVKGWRSGGDSRRES